MNLTNEDGFTDIITLSLQESVWHATYSGPHESEVFRLFGTDTLPVPFSAKTGADVVRDRIQALNPRCIVAIA